MNKRIYFYSFLWGVAFEAIILFVLPFITFFSQLPEWILNLSKSIFNFNSSNELVGAGIIYVALSIVGLIIFCLIFRSRLINGKSVLKMMGLFILGSALVYIIFLIFSVIALTNFNPAF